LSAYIINEISDLLRNEITINTLSSKLFQIEDGRKSSKPILGKIYDEVIMMTNQIMKKTIKLQLKPVITREPI